MEVHFHNSVKQVCVILREEGPAQTLQLGRSARLAVVADKLGIVGLVVEQQSVWVILRTQTTALCGQACQCWREFCARLHQAQACPHPSTPWLPWPAEGHQGRSGAALERGGCGWWRQGWRAAKPVIAQMRHTRQKKYIYYLKN